MEVGRRGKLTGRGQEGYFRQVVWTRRENERDGQGENHVRDITQVRQDLGTDGNDLGITKKNQEEWTIGPE